MTKGFFRSLIGLGLMALLLVVTAINIWQSERIERNQLEMEQRVSTVEKQLSEGVVVKDGPRATSIGAPTGGIHPVPDPAYITAALRTRPTSSSKTRPTSRPTRSGATC